MNKKNLRAIAAIAILSATVTFFVYYFLSHPAVRKELANLSIYTLIGLLALYTLVFGSLVLINDSIVRLCRVRLDATQNILIAAYTSVVNFFGPLQSGPAFRAVYLKKKYDINLKNYAFATLIYYLLFAAFSGLFLLYGLLHYWLIIMVIAAIVIFFALSTDKSIKKRLISLDLSNLYYLAGATLLQVSLLATVYFAELHSVNKHVSLSQAVVYTGAANFAMFVSITPGAIGFRETFLVFSQRLHHINNQTIVAANILDRSVYIIFLLLVALIILLTHTKERLDTAVKED